MWVVFLGPVDEIFIWHARGVVVLVRLIFGDPAQKFSFTRKPQSTTLIIVDAVSIYVFIFFSVGHRLRCAIVLL